MDLEQFVNDELNKLITGPERIYTDLDLYEGFVTEHGYEPKWDEFHVVVNGVEAGGWCLAGEIGKYLQRQMGIANPTDEIMFFADSIIRACEGLNEEDARACVLANVAHERRHSFQPLSLYLEKGGMAESMKLYDALPHEADANNFMLNVLRGKATLEDVKSWPIDTTCNWTH